MRKVYFIIGLLGLSTMIWSCANDDRLEQEIQEHKKEKGEIALEQNKALNKVFENGKSGRGDEDLDKNKKKGKGKGKNDWTLY